MTERYDALHHPMTLRKQRLYDSLSSRFQCSPLGEPNVHTLGEEPAGVLRQSTTFTMWQHRTAACYLISCLDAVAQGHSSGAMASTPRGKFSHCVCEFQLLEDDAIFHETVPYNWLVFAKDGDGPEFCWYPPENWTTALISKAVVKMLAPDPATWNKWSFNLLGRYGWFI